MLCLDVLLVLMGSLAGQKKAVCSQHSATGFHFIALLKLHQVPVGMELYLLLAELHY